MGLRNAESMDNDSSVTSNRPCRLLELPPEIREQIWIFAVTEWLPEKNTALCTSSVDWGCNLSKQAIRIDRLNRPLPPALTTTCRQIYSESLHLYYIHNIFELWRPLFSVHDWSQSTFIDWLINLGPEKVSWLSDIRLLYKHENELEDDIEEALWGLGFAIGEGVVSNQPELTEYEKCYEDWGLPRHFGRKRKW